RDPGPPQPRPATSRLRSVCATAAPVWERGRPCACVQCLLPGPWPWLWSPLLPGPLFEVVGVEDGGGASGDGGAGQSTMTSGPDCSNGATSGLGRGSPERSRFSGFASTFVQAASGAPGSLASMPFTQSTIGGTPPVVSA